LAAHCAKTWQHCDYNNSSRKITSAAFVKTLYAWTVAPGVALYSDWFAKNNPALPAAHTRKVDTDRGDWPLRVFSTLDSIYVAGRIVLACACAGASVVWGGGCVRARVRGSVVNVPVWQGIFPLNIFPGGGGLRTVESMTVQPLALIELRTGPAYPASKPINSAGEGGCQGFLRTYLWRREVARLSSPRYICPGINAARQKTAPRSTNGGPVTGAVRRMCSCFAKTGYREVREKKPSFCLRLYAV
ncbi:hypothetical protein LSAT2_022334, partial [Lamellibrachia satsuma]